MGGEKVVVVGQGYVGLPLAMAAVRAGFDVVAIEADATRASMLADGNSYVTDVESSRLRAALATGRYRPTATFDDATAFAYALICVPTPLSDRAPDLSFICDASTQLAPHLGAGGCVILESTTYPGTTEESVAPLLEAGSGLIAGVDFFLGYSPERIDPGNATYRLENTPKLVAGINAASLEHVDSFVSQLVAITVRMPGCREAELAKLIENTFRHVNIALVNELAMFASALGVDVWAALDGAATKPFGFMKFEPGPGVGGHCLPIDPSFLSWRVERSVGASFRFVELANDINAHMPGYVTNRVMHVLNRAGKAVMGSTILVLGAAYKRNTADPRESPGLRVAELLSELGALVQIVDPYVDVAHLTDRAKQVDLTPDRLTSCDCVVLITDHDAFDYDAVVEHAPMVLDTRHRMPAAPNVERL